MCEAAYRRTLQHILILFIIEHTVVPLKLTSFLMVFPNILYRIELKLNPSVGKLHKESRNKQLQ